MENEILTPSAMHTTPSRTANRAGFTLIEMMMAVLLTMLVFAITIPFFRNQTRALDGGAGRRVALVAHVSSSSAAGASRREAPRWQLAAQAPASRDPRSRRNFGPNPI